MPSSPPQPLPEFPLASAVKAKLVVGSGATGIGFEAATAGAAGNEISVVTATDSGAVTSVSASGKAITITLAAKARMQVTGTLTRQGSESITFPVLVLAGLNEGRPQYFGADLQSYVAWDGSKWVLDHTVGLAGGVWHSTDDVATPDLVTTWTPQDSATGTPAVTALSSSAAQVETAVDGSVSSLVATTLTGDGSGTFPAVSPAQYLKGGYSVASSPGAVLADGQAASPSSPPTPLGDGQGASPSAPSAPLSDGQAASPSSPPAPLSDGQAASPSSPPQPTP